MVGIGGVLDNLEWWYRRCARGRGLLEGCRWGVVWAKGDLDWWRWGGVRCKGD